MNFVTKWFTTRAARELLEMSMLKGYKTYIVGSLLALLNIAKMFGWIPVDLADDLTGFLLGLGVMTVRNAIGDSTTK